MPSRRKLLLPSQTPDFIRPAEFFLFAVGTLDVFAVWMTETRPDGRVVAIAPEGT